MDADTEHRIDDRSPARASHAGADERRVSEGSDDAEALAAGEAAFPAGGAALDTGVVDGLSAGLDAQLVETGAAIASVPSELDQNPLASPFPPIADYGFLSDCEVTALVAPSGNVEWLCLPRMDSPSVFAAMLDRDAGGFRFGPGEVSVPV